MPKKPKSKPQELPGIDQPWTVVAKATHTGPKERREAIPNHLIVWKLIHTDTEGKSRTIEQRRGPNAHRNLHDLASQLNRLGVVPATHQKCFADLPSEASRLTAMTKAESGSGIKPVAIK